MSDPVVSNIFKSGAILWYAPAGEALPDETTVGAGDAWGGNWARLGFTSMPLSCLYEFDEADIEVEEYLAAVDRYKQAEKGTLETKLAELTADYLALVGGGTVTTVAAGAGQVGYEELDIGGVIILTKYIVGFEGIRYDASDNGLPVRVFARRCTMKINGALEFSKRDENYPGIPVQIKALADTDNNGRLFTWQRVTAPATS